MITKATLAKDLKRHNLSYRTAALCVDLLFESIKGYLSEGEHIEIRNFGTFSISKRAPRKTALNGQRVIPAHGKVTFRPYEKLRRSAWGPIHDNPK